MSLFVCENGFISINPPLTGSRLGSLSTRTTNPIFLSQFQQLLEVAGIRVHIENPYQYITKGEMLKNCCDQALLQILATRSTSCSRFTRFKYKHCGRCLPCLIRRAAFHASDIPDTTQYVFADLSRDDLDHARFDDVRSVAMAIALWREDGVDAWVRPALNATTLGNLSRYLGVIDRGMEELDAFFESMNIN